MKHTMTHTFTSRRKSLALALIVAFAFSAVAPIKAAPTERARLLNGLSFFLLPQPGASNVSLFLRIHSGAAFDLAGKEGTMDLLARSLFPDENTRTFVEEELDGRMDVMVDYDAINIRLSGRADALETLVELLRNALVTSTQVDAQTLVKLRVRENATDAKAIADRAAAARLFGSYPLGRPVAGTPESLARIDRADLIYARERFLAPNNATLFITGAVDPTRTRRLLRQYLGAWRRSDTVAQETFRLPDAPSAKVLMVPVAGTDATEIRFNFRAPARASRDYLAAAIVRTMVLSRLLRASVTGTPPRSFDVDYKATKLAGALTVRAAAPAPDAAATLRFVQTTLRALGSTAPPTADELQTARAGLAMLNTAPADPASIAFAQLDADTYGAGVSDTATRLQGVTLADVRGVAADLFGENNGALVVVGDTAKIEEGLTRAGFAVETPASTASAQTLDSPLPRTSTRAREVPVTPLVANPQPAKPTAPPTPRATPTPGTKRP